MTSEEWAEKHCPELREQLRSTLSIHVDNRSDVPRILRMVLTAIKEQFDGPREV